MKPSSINQVTFIAYLLYLASFTSKAAHLESAALVDASNPVQPIGDNLQDKFTLKANAFQFNKQVTPYLQINKLTTTLDNVTCNDGSAIGYYMRLNNNSKSWIIYLQGGGFCGSEESCKQRWQRSPQLMSSNYWPETKAVDGILSSEPKDNPYLWNANHIYIPYCSSDSWTGLSSAKTQTSAGKTNSYSFMGSKILERVLESLYDDLPRDSSLYEAKFILLAGDSAGATGVILNLDRLNEIVERKSNTQHQMNCQGQTITSGCKEQRQAPVLRGLADSGWFLDNEPYDYERNEQEFGEQETNSDDNCTPLRCTPLQSIRQAMNFWNGQVPSSCAVSYPTEPWRCYFGYRVYQTLKTPLFVVQWLYDEAQLMVDNIARPNTSRQWNYVNKVVNELRASLENVTALFAPSCLSHSLIVTRSWNQININGFKLPHVLNGWEEQSFLGTTIAIASQRLQLRADESSLQKSLYGREMLTNISLSSNQPSYEALMLPSDDAVLGSVTSNISSKESDKTQFTSSQDWRQITPRTAQPKVPNRPRSRKRKRNNQQRSKQARPKVSPNVENFPPTTALESISSTQATKDSNDLSSTNPLHDLLPLIDRSLNSADLLFGRLSKESVNTGVVNGRLGRSTLVDDSTLMLANNVPDDNLANQMQTSSSDSRRSTDRTSTRDFGDYSYSLYGGRISSNSNSDQFRLIDSCGWPQCNRDCPVMELGLYQP